MAISQLDRLTIAAAQRPGTDARLLASRGAWQTVPRLKAYQGVVGRVVGNVNRVLPDPNAADFADLTAAQRGLARQWSDIKVSLSAVPDLFESLSFALQGIAFDASRTPEFQAEQSQSVIASAEVELVTLGASIETASNALLDKARTVSLPRRPTPADATQEARLAGLKSDLALSTSRLPGGIAGAERFVKIVCDALTQAIASGDDLSLWLLASSGWVLGPLLSSTGLDADSTTAVMVMTAWRRAVGDQLAAGSADTVRGLGIVAALEDLSEGLPALQVATGAFMRSIVGDVAAFTADVTRGAR